jgi:hypothetical protein
LTDLVKLFSRLCELYKTKNLPPNLMRDGG